MAWQNGRRVYVGGVLALLIICSGGLSSAHRARAAATSGTWQRVLTHIQGAALAAGSGSARLLEAGPGDAPGSTAWYYALIDTQHHRVLARVPIAGAVSAVVLDEQRRRGYLIGAVAPPQAAAQNYLWTVDLRSGRLLDHQAYAEGGPGALAGVALDQRTGMIVMALGQGPTCCWTTGWGTLLLVNPHTLWMRRTPLVAQPTWMAVDSAAGRVVVALAVPAPSSSSQLSTIVEGIDSRTGAVAWTRPFAYVSAGIAANPRTGQVWLLAPGGLITRLSSRQGATVGLLPVTPDASGPSHYSSLFIDPAHDIGYVVRDDGSPYSGTCAIDRAQVRSGSHRTVVIHFGSPTCGSLVGIDPASGILMVTQGNAVHAIDPRTTPATDRQLGVQGDQIAAPAPAVLTTPAGRLTVGAFPASVPDYNQETGGTTAAGLVFVPIIF